METNQAKQNSRQGDLPKIKGQFIMTIRVNIIVDTYLPDGKSQKKFSKNRTKERKRNKF